MNPKEAAGAQKIPLHLFPTTAVLYGALGMLEGQLKYGRSNFRASEVFASTYYAAALRHLNLWFEGEEHDPDSKVPHLANAISCIAILIDTTCNGSMIDDRMFHSRAGYRLAVDRLSPLVEYLKSLHDDKKPKNYDARDTPTEPTSTVNSGWIVSRTGVFRYKSFTELDNGDCLVDLSEFKEGRYEGDREAIICALLRDGTAQIRQARHVEWLRVWYWKLAPIVPPESNQGVKKAWVISKDGEILYKPVEPEDRFLDLSEFKEVQRPIRTNQVPLAPVPITVLYSNGIGKKRSSATVDWANDAEPRVTHWKRDEVDVPTPPKPWSPST